MGTGWLLSFLGEEAGLTGKTEVPGAADATKPCRVYGARIFGKKRTQKEKKSEKKTSPQVVRFGRRSGPDRAAE